MDVYRRSGRVITLATAVLIRGICEQMSEVRRFIPVVVGIDILRKTSSKAFEKDPSYRVEIKEVLSFITHAIAEAGIHSIVLES